MDDRIATSKQALQAAIASGDALALQTAYADLGQAFFQSSQLPQALQCYETLLRSTQSTPVPFADRPRETLAAQGIAHCHIGMICFVMAEYPKALASLHKHLAISQQLSDTAAQGLAYSNMGMVYEALEELSKSLYCHQQALAVAEQHGHVAEQGIAYTSMGSLYERLGEHERSLHCHHNALAIAEATGDVDAQATACGYISKAYYAVGQPGKATEFQVEGRDWHCDAFATSIACGCHGKPWLPFLHCGRGGGIEVRNFSQFRHFPVPIPSIFPQLFRNLLQFLRNCFLCVHLGYLLVPCVFPVLLC